MSAVEAVVVVKVCLRLRTVAPPLVIVVGVGEVVVATIPDDVDVLGCGGPVDVEVGIGIGLDLVATTIMDILVI